MSSQTEESTTPAAQNQGSHHYVLTLDLPGRVAGTWYGTVTPACDDTRHSLFVALRDHVGTENPAFARANVVFFSLEPNRL